MASVSSESNKLFSSFLKSLPPIKRIIRSLDNQDKRDNFVKKQLSHVPAGSLLLDAGCGNQRYRESCKHLQYRGQDFGAYMFDEKRSYTDGSGGVHGYTYGKLDYVSDVWSIEEKTESFDAILCTEVFEHIPYPVETIKEFARLLKRGGVLILTAPSNCLRHFDPYYFYSGFSDRWYQKILAENGFCIEILNPIGDYYSWLAIEVGRVAMSHSLLAKFALAPAFFYFASKQKTERSINTMCIEYHVVARKAN